MDITPFNSGARVSVALVLALTLGACAKPRQEATPAQVNFQNAASKYVGDTACFNCHEEQWRGFQEHGMARSFYRLTPDKAVEDFEAAPLWHAGSGFYYRVYAEGEAYYQEEYRLGPDGAKTHRLTRRMDYVVGSGHAARTYLTSSGGRLYEMPLTWYTQGDRWDFSPGYALHNKRFDRLAPQRCMACHNSYPRAVPLVEGKYEEVPSGIGCERCHGPGSLHVAERLSSPEPVTDVDPTIVNPAHLSQALQMDVCQQCHLNATVSLLREGRGPFDFRPSQKLEDHVALFAEEGPRECGTIGVISHARRLRQSACFAGAAQSMTCTTCHNPHEGFRDKGPQYFSATCMSCHNVAEEALSPESHTAASDCIACHMPKAPAQGAPHASFTDHWIRVVIDSLPEPRPAHGPPELTPYFARDAEGAEARRYEALSYLVHGTQQSDTLALEKGIALMRTALAQAQDTTGEAQFLLGVTLWRLGRAEESLGPLSRSIELGPVAPERLNALAQAYETVGRDLDIAERLYERALEAEPALADIRVNYGRLLQARGQLRAALEQYRQAAAEKPWLSAAHYNLGTAFLQDGAFEDAEAALLRALELEPDYPDALGNLGLLLLTQGRREAAQRRFEWAVAVAPDNATALSNLGTFYLEQNNLSQAIALLERAVEADPRYVGAMINLSMAHARSDDYLQARRYAQMALSIDPGNAVAQRILDAL